MLDRTVFGWSGQVVIHVMLFMLLLAGCCSYALIVGGAPERIVAVMLIGATCLTILCQRVPTYQNYQTVEIGVMLVDILLLLGLILISLFSLRYWPIWLSGIQIVEVSAHVVRMIDPKLLPVVYTLVLALSGYPVVLILGIGALRHRRRMALYGVDPAWKEEESRKSRGFEQAALESDEA